MPRVSLDPASFYIPSSRGFIEMVGVRKLGEITGVHTQYVQWQPSKQTGAQQEPLTSAFLHIAEIDAQGNQISIETEQELVVEWGPKDKSRIRIRPGNAADREAETVDTVGPDGILALGAEGNVLYSEEGVTLNARNAFPVFITSLKEKGFKPAVLATGYLPDIVGTRAYFELRPRKYTSRGEEKSATEFVVSEIVRYPYEQAAKAAAAPAPAPAPRLVSQPRKVNGSTQATSNSTATAPAEPQVESLVLDLMAKVSQEIAAGPRSREEFSRVKLMAMAMQKAVAPGSGIGADQQQICQKMLKDQAWFESHAADFGAVSVGSDKYQLIGI